MAMDGFSSAGDINSHRSNGHEGGRRNDEEDAIIGQRNKSQNLAFRRWVKFRTTELKKEYEDRRNLVYIEQDDTAKCGC